MGMCYNYTFDFIDFSTFWYCIVTLNNEKTQVLSNRKSLTLFLGPGDEGAQEYDFGNYEILIYSSKENYKTVLQKP